MLTLNPGSPGFGHQHVINRVWWHTTKISSLGAEAEGLKIQGRLQLHLQFKSPLVQKTCWTRKGITVIHFVNFHEHNICVHGDSMFGHSVILFPPSSLKLTVSFWGVCAKTHFASIHPFIHSFCVWGVRRCGTHKHACGGQRSTWQSWFFLSTMWILEIELRQSGLVACVSLTTEPSVPRTVLQTTLADMMQQTWCSKVRRWQSWALILWHDTTFPPCTIQYSLAGAEKNLSVQFGRVSLYLPCHNSHQAAHFSSTRPFGLARSRKP